MATMLDSQLAWAVTRDPALRDRIEALIRKTAVENGVTASEAEMLRTPPIEQVLWAVAGNGSMFSALKDRIASQPADEPNVGAAIAEGVSDGDLTWLIAQEITCLQGG